MTSYVHKEIDIKTDEMQFTYLISTIKRFRRGINATYSAKCIYIFCYNPFYFLEILLNDSFSNRLNYFLTHLNIEGCK